MHSVTSGALFSDKILNVVLPYVPAKSWVSLACVNQDLVERMQVCFHHGIYSWGGAYLEGCDEIFLHACKKGYSKLVICYLEGKRKRESLKSCLNLFSRGFKQALEYEQHELLVPLLDFLFQLMADHNSKTVFQEICETIKQLELSCITENKLSYTVAAQVKRLIGEHICYARKLLVLTQTCFYWKEIVLSAMDCLCSQTNGELTQAFELFPSHEKFQINYCGLPSKDLFYHFIHLAKLIGGGYREIIAHFVVLDAQEEKAYLQLIEIAKTFGIKLQYARLKKDIKKLKKYDIVAGSFPELLHQILPSNKCYLTTNDSDFSVGSVYGSSKFEIFKHDGNPEWFIPWISSLKSIVYVKEKLNFAFVANATAHDFLSGNECDEPRYDNWNSTKSYLFNAIQALQRDTLKKINLYLYLGAFDSQEETEKAGEALLDFFMRLMPNKNLLFSISLFGSYLNAQKILLGKSLDIFIMTSSKEFLLQASFELMQKHCPKTIQYYICETEDHDENHEKDKVWGWAGNSPEYFTPR